MRILIALVLITLLASSCSHERKIRRANKKIAKLVVKYPELIRTDTIWYRDTIIIDGATADTVLINSITRDTIIIRDRQLTIKYFNTGDSIYIAGECDTIYKTIEVPVEVQTIQPLKRVKYTPKFVKFSAWAFWILLLLIAAFIAGRIYVKKYGWILPGKK